MLLLEVLTVLVAGVAVLLLWVLLLLLPWVHLLLVLGISVVTLLLTRLPLLLLDKVLLLLVLWVNISTRGLRHLIWNHLLPVALEMLLTALGIRLLLLLWWQLHPASLAHRVIWRVLSAHVLRHGLLLHSMSVDHVTRQALCRIPTGDGGMLLLLLLVMLLRHPTHHNGLLARRGAMPDDPGHPWLWSHMLLRYPIM